MQRIDWKGMNPRIFLNPQYPFASTQSVYKRRSSPAMSDISTQNVHDPQFREAKPSQGSSSRSVESLFRLDNRTVISMS